MSECNILKKHYRSDSLQLLLIMHYPAAGLFDTGDLKGMISDSDHPGPGLFDPGDLKAEWILAYLCLPEAGGPDQFTCLIPCVGGPDRSEKTGPYLSGLGKGIHKPFKGERNITAQIAYKEPAFLYQHTVYFLKYLDGV